MNTCIRAAAVFTAVLLSGCGYRLVDPLSGEKYALAEVGNTTPEAGLDRILAEELNDLGSFDPGSKNRLTVIVTRFEETVATVSSDGKTVRERLKMEVAWKVQDPGDSQAAFGKETVTRTYPFSDDPAALEWTRSAAIRFLAGSAAERVLDRIGELP